MPKPNGWTDREVKHRDKVAEALIRKGYNSEQAFAIATSKIIQNKKGGTRSA